MNESRGMRSILFLCVAGVVFALPYEEKYDCSFKAAYPRQYVAHKRPADEAIVIDGEIDDKAWQHLPWTEDFVDIMTTTHPKFRTAAKVTWDSEFLYVAARMEEPQGWANIKHTCHCINASQDQIIYHDNDFEVFIDPQGSTHYYKEFEINALGATWDLCLNKPYSNAGYENSSRVFGEHGFDMPAQKAASAVQGTLNDPSRGTKSWTTEFALPLSSLIYNQSVPLPPRKGNFWRINFSRVEWHVTVENNKYVKTPACQSCASPGAALEDNWVWQPMAAVNMHIPQRWGMLLFADELHLSNTNEEVLNPEWPVRYVAATVYDAQQAYAAQHGGKFTTDIAELNLYLSDKKVIDGTCTSKPQISLGADGKSFEAKVVSAKEGFSAMIRDDRLLTVNKLDAERVVE